MYRLRVKAIPFASKENKTLQIAAATSIKPIYRPDALKMPTLKNRAINSSGMLQASGLKDFLMRPTAAGKQGLSILPQQLARRPLKSIHIL
jgi:hypothetical protein